MASTIFWPFDEPVEALPYPLRQGYSISPRTTAIRTDAALVNHAQQIHTDAATDVQFSLALTASQWAILESFWLVELDAGTQWFWLPLRMAGAQEAREVQFTAEPDFSLRGVLGAMPSFQVQTRRGQ